VSLADGSTFDMEGNGESIGGANASIELPIPAAVKKRSRLSPPRN
jgi:hypothetical protein